MGRAGLNRKTALATLTLTLAAEAPDLDVIGRFWGRAIGFEHHRGFTHSFVGVPLDEVTPLSANLFVQRREELAHASPRPSEVEVAADAECARPRLRRFPEPIFQPGPPITAARRFHDLNRSRQSTHPELLPRFRGCCHVLDPFSPCQTGDP